MRGRGTRTRCSPPPRPRPPAPPRSPRHARPPRGSRRYPEVSKYFCKLCKYFPEGGGVDLVCPVDGDHLVLLVLVVVHLGGLGEPPVPGAGRGVLGGARHSVLGVQKLFLLKHSRKF